MSDYKTYVMLKGVAYKILATDLPESELQMVLNYEGDEAAIEICVAYLDFAESSKSDEDKEVLKQAIDDVGEEYGGEHFDLYKSSIPVLVDNYLKAEKEEEEKEEVVVKKVVKEGEANGMCHAKTKKGDACKSKAKFGNFCGRHRYAAEAKLHNTKDNDSESESESESEHNEMCQAKTKKGDACKYFAKSGNFCGIHSHRSAEEAKLHGDKAPKEVEERDVGEWEEWVEEGEDFEEEEGFEYEYC